MALLVEGLAVGEETTLEEYIIGPAIDQTEEHDLISEKDQIRLYGVEQGLSWVARPIKGQSNLGTVSRHGSSLSQSMSLVDPLVTLFGSVHEKIPEMGSMRSTLFPHFGSMFSVGGGYQQARNEDLDEECVAREGEEYQSDANVGGGDESDDNLESPLISRQDTSLEKDLTPRAHGSTFSMQQGSDMTRGEL